MLKLVVRRPFAVLMFHGGMLLLGGLALARLPVEFLPTVVVPVSHVVAELEGIPAVELEELVTQPLEAALYSVRGVRELSSVTRDGICCVSLRFDWGARLADISVSTREAVDAIHPFLAQGLRKPVVFTEDLNAVPLALLAVTAGPGIDPAGLSETIRTELASRLLARDGLGGLRLKGLRQPEIAVMADEARLASAGLSIQDLARTVAGGLVELPAGSLLVDGRERLLSVGMPARDERDIAALPLPARGGGGILKVADLATVHLGERQASSFFLADGREAVGLYVYKSPEAGTLNAAASLRAGLAELMGYYAGMIEISLLRDSEPLMREAIMNLAGGIVLGVIACTGVLFIFMRGRGAPLVIAASIPASLGLGFFGMQLASIGLNLISLSGIALGVGMIVDNSIVVLENLISRRARSQAECLAAIREMAASTFGSTATTLIIFLPVCFVPGILGALFGQLAAAMGMMLAASWLVSLSLTPALYLLASRTGRGFDRDPVCLRRAVLAYRRGLGAFAGRPGPAAAGMFFCAVALGLLLAGVPKEISPARPGTLLEGRLELAEDSSLETTRAWCRELSAELQALAGIGFVVMEAGYEQTGLLERARERTDPGLVRLQFGLDTADQAEALQLHAEIAARLSARGALKLDISPPPDPIERLLGLGKSRNLSFSAATREAAVRAAGLAADGLAARGLVRAFSIDTRRDRREHKVRLRPAALARSGLTPADLRDHLAAAAIGLHCGNIQREGVPTGVRVRSAASDPASLSRVVRGPAGFIPLGSLTELEQTSTWGELNRRQRRPAVGLTVWPSPGNDDGLSAALNLARRQFGQAGQDDLVVDILNGPVLEQNGPELGRVFLLALLFMYLYLAAQFDSLGLPALLMAGVPLSAAGSLALLWVAGDSLNLNSLLGVLVLFGTTINSTIILADTCLARAARDARAVAGACSRRLKPILLTVATSLVALLPIMLNGSAGAAMQRSTALALFGGLVFGTAVDLWLFPPLFALLIRRPDRPSQAGATAWPS